MAIKKIYYSIGEVAEMFDVNRSLIRHWESKFDCIKPTKNKKGNRLFTASDVEKLKQIYHLVKEQGMTLDGANKVLKRSGKGVSRDTELLERLQKIRSVLEEVREELKADSADSVYSSDDVEQPMADEPMADMTDAVVEESAAEEIVDEKPKKVAKSVVTKIIEPSEQPSEDAPASAKKRVVRRKKRGEEEDKELFAFYEQSLF
jgi:DNA-binding transcriptional MerR regulator